VATSAFGLSWNVFGKFLIYALLSRNGRSDRSSFELRAKTLLVKTLRFLTIMLVSLSMGMTFCRLMEMPAKAAYDGRLWLTLHQTLYDTFGTIGPFIEAGAVITVSQFVTLP
jgi:hypothetical protein